MEDFDFSKLSKTEHMLKWLADKPYGAMLENITAMLQQQVSDSTISSFKVTSEPDWLTAGLPVAGEKEKVTVSRVGCAFEFIMDVETQGQVHHLVGVYSWVGIHLETNGKHRQKTWLDIDKQLDTLGYDGVLKERLYFEKE